MYLYVYWSPIIAKLFFGEQSGNTNLIYTFLIFALGLLSRPLGGLFFGRLGDRIGRKKAFILSLLMMTIPTFITGILPIYTQVGLLAPILLTCTRFLQSFPAGGELPGAFCYLYEASQIKNRRYYCSWACFGVLAGLLLSTIECFFLESLLPQEALISWGWRLSFLFGGVLGLCGILIRTRLHETPLYQEMVKHSSVIKESLVQVLYEQRKPLFKGMVFWLFNSSAVFFITVNAPGYFKKILNNNSSTYLIFSSALLVLIVLSIPFFGYFASKLNNKKILIWTTISSMFLLLVLGYFVAHSSLLGFSLTIAVFALLFSCNTALLSYITPNLFPTRVRYTCVAVSFNIVDSLVGGFTPFFALYLTHLTSYKGAFSWVILFFSVFSLISYITMRDKDHV